MICFSLCKWTSWDNWSSCQGHVFNQHLNLVTALQQPPTAKPCQANFLSTNPTDLILQILKNVAGFLRNGDLWSQLGFCCSLSSMKDKLANGSLHGETQSSSIIHTVMGFKLDLTFCNQPATTRGNVEVRISLEVVSPHHSITMANFSPLSIFQIHI